MVNEDDDDDFRWKSGMTMLYLGEEPDQKDPSKMKKELYYFPRKLPLEYEERLNKEIAEDVKNIEKIYAGTYFKNEVKN